MKMSKFESKYFSGNRHMICIGKTKSTSDKRSIEQIPAIIGSLSNHDDDSNKNPINLHILQ